MSAKRAAISSASSGPRQFKQTKLSFGSRAPAHKRPRLAPEEHQAKATAATRDDAGLVTEQPEEPQQTPDDTLTRAQETTDPETTSKESPQDPSDLAASKPAAPGPDPAPTSNPTPSRIHITDKTGDLFAAPPHTLLIHACNAVGSWGGGIALAFRKRYPAEFKLYHAHCLRSTPDKLVGTALLIPPVQQQQQQQQGAKGHYIGCLFTSRRYGKARDPPGRILEATGPAMRDLMRLVVEEKERGGRIGEVRMCRINSGLFGVPWARSKAAIEGLELGEGEVPEGMGDGGVVEVVAYEREE
ncbi:ADP-ribose 1''-phosphate phosphatase [Madurella fahalii]|uniref:ADP-ribose 1''-phosphate phosphatase n=1 Tax=Madurella fahalii TaxID=1157608 RepID=A0ABQ0G748_9PEZI